MKVISSPYRSRFLRKRETCTGSTLRNVVAGIGAKSETVPAEGVPSLLGFTIAAMMRDRECSESGDKCSESVRCVERVFIRGRSTLEISVASKRSDRLSVASPGLVDRSVNGSGNLRSR